MKLSFRCILLITLFFIQHAYSQSIIINELFNSSGNDEWMELLVLEEGLDIRNWSIRDFSSSGVVQSSLNFTNSDLWNNLRKGTLIVIARSENTFSQDLDASDYTLNIKTNNALYFSGTAFLFAGSSEAVQIRNAAQIHIYGVSWGAANSASLPDPKVHFTSSASSNTSTFFNEDDVSKLSTTTNWTMNGTPSRGEGNTVNNNNWIISLRARVEGSGSVSIDPNVVKGDSLINLTFSYKRDTNSPINALKIIFPQGFLWSQNIAQISTNNFASVLSVSADTISFSDILFDQDSIIITISDLTTPLSTGKYKFQFFSGVNEILAEVSPAPILTVYGTAVPISQAKNLIFWHCNKSYSLPSSDRIHSIIQFLDHTK